MLLRAGIAHGKLDGEAVQLGLRQGEGALGLDGVLGGHHEEGRVQGVGLAVVGDLLFLHAFQHGALAAGGGAVDLIGQQHVAEHRARPEVEGRVLGIEHAHARHVRGEQVGGELDAAEAAGDGRGQGAGQQGLARAGHVLQQGVAAGKEGAEQELDLRVLAHDYPLNVFLNFLSQCLYL